MSPRGAGGKMISAVGIGPWGRQELTFKAKGLIDSADCLLGSERQLEVVRDLDAAPGELDEIAHPRAKEIVYKDLKDLCAHLEAHSGKSFVVLASGDPSFYGIAKYLCDKFGKAQVDIVPGISSVQYLFAKAQVDMNDIYMTSGHGRPLNMEKVMLMEKTVILTDGKLGPFQIAEKVLSYGEDPLMIIGESLGSEEEQITIVKASEVKDRAYEINVVIVDRREGGSSQ